MCPFRLVFWWPVVGLVGYGEGCPKVTGLASDEGRNAKGTARIARILDIGFIQQVAGKGFKLPLGIGRLEGHPQIEQAIGVLELVLDPVAGALQSWNVVVIVKEQLGLPRIGRR